MLPIRKSYQYVLLFLSLIVLVYQIHGNWQLLYSVTNGKLIPTLTPGTPFEKRLEKFIYKGIAGNLIDNFIYYTGTWEPEETGFLKESLQKTDINQSIFLDIGANTGWHSLCMSQYAKTVHAIEPYPPVLERFNDMISVNKIGNISVHAVGFSNVEGALPYYAPPGENLGTGSFDPLFSSQNSKSIDLPLVVGDTYLAEQGISRVDVIKIDIEGYERIALQGLTKILNKNRPIVAMELNTNDGGFDAKDQFFDTFPKDYRFFYIERVQPIWAKNFGSYFFVFGQDLDSNIQYRLKYFDFKFEKQVNLAAIPIEKLTFFQNKIAQSSSSEGL